MAKELHRAPESLAVWESNMKELRKWQPRLAAMLDEYVEKYGHAFEHYENATPAGKWIEGLTEEPFFVSDDEPKFNWSKKKREDKNKPVFILYGTGTPPYVFKAIRALPNAALAFLIVEPNLSLIAYTLHLTHVYLALPKGCRLVFVTEGEGEGETDEERLETKAICTQMLREESLSYALLPVGTYAAALSALSAHPGELELFQDRFSYLGRHIREWITLTLTYLGNSAEDTLLGLRQIALMSPQIAFGPKLAAIRKKFGDRPAVLVAAGPSLDKNFMLLKGIQDKCVIIAADAVLEKLLENGIKPHIVTSLERVVLTYDLFFSKTVDKYREECKDILLVVQALCVPWTSGRWPGPVCFVYKDETASDQWLAGSILQGNPLTSGTSVAHMNYSLAHAIGVPSIAIIGQDLAYGEDGKSHAGSVSGSFNMRSSEVLEVPGALGGTVFSNRVWVSFLRFLENLIRRYEIPTWDCTEGGAHISKTNVLPFADFISEKIENLSSMERTPSDLIREYSDGSDRCEIRDRIVSSIEGHYEQFEMLERQLDGVLELMDNVRSAGLEPARRIAFAAKAGQKLDSIHAMSPAFDFIGQSYTRLAAIELSLTRSLEDVETVERWYAMHKEIIDSHRAILDFLRKWIAYAQRSVRYWGSKDEIDFGPLPPDVAWEKAILLLQAVSDADADGGVAARLELDSVMMRCDPVLLKWPGRILWSYALLLMEQERAALATRFMDAAAEDFEGTEMPVADMVAFFKDYARVLMGHDLTYTPDYLKAETMLANAVELGGGADEESRAILAALLNAEIAHTTVMDELLGLSRERSTVEWFKARAVAQKALYEGNLKRALSAVWRAIVDNWRAVPGWAASHLDWLATTLEKCAVVDDALLQETIGNILDEMAENKELLGNIRLLYTETFAMWLRERGLELELAVVDEEVKSSRTGEELVDALPEDGKLEILGEIILSV